MNRIAMRSVAIWVLVGLMLGGLVFFLVEYFLYGDEWVMTQGSPHVYSGTNINTGVITDRDGVLLLDTSENRTYAATKEIRASMIHWLGDRYGYISAPAVAAYAKEMAGYSSLTGLYSYSGTGKATLTISSQLQTAALKAMGEYKGTVAIYNYKTGEILCAVTTPNYDPDNVPQIQEDDSAFEGVYMNRFTQSVYIPGSIFKTVTAAAALEEIEDIHEQTFTCTGSYEYGKEAVTCEKVHGKLDFDSALAQSCNCAFAQIIDQLGAEKLDEYVRKYHITDPVTFDGITTAAGNFDVTDAAALEVAWSGIGQHLDQVNPCRFLTYMGTIANDGVQITPHLVKQVSCGSSVTYQAKAQTGDRIMPRETAQELQRMMRNNVIEKYGTENFPELTICAKSGTAQVGGDQKSNAMFAGFITDEEYPLAFLVAVEDGGYGRQICIPILTEILEVCMKIM